ISKGEGTNADHSTACQKKPRSEEKADEIACPSTVSTASGCLFAGENEDTEETEFSSSKSGLGPSVHRARGDCLYRGRRAQSSRTQHCISSRRQGKRLARGPLPYRARHSRLCSGERPKTRKIQIWGKTSQEVILG